MPTLDMPLKELQQYKGINPRPADFDVYWDSAVARVKELDPQVTVTPAEFKSPIVDCFHMYFTGEGGVRIYAKLLKPKQKGPHPALLQFHGYGANCGDWHDKIGFAASGFILASMDCRGQGGLSEDCITVKGNTKEGMIIRGLDDPDPEKLYFRHVFMDAVLLARIVMEMEDVDEARVGTMGGSQGGALSIACAALEPRINRAAAAFPFLTDYKRVWEMDLCKNAYYELIRYFRFFDPTHAREDEIFTKLGYIDVHHLAPRVKPRLLLFTGLMDEICPPSTQYAIYNNLTCPREIVVYPDYGHEGIPTLDDRTYQYMMEMLK